MNNTLEAIKARCDEVGDCWIWRDATTGEGYPIFKPAGSKKCELVRRYVFALAGGRLKARVPVVAKCGERKCVNPACARESTTAKIAHEAGKRGSHSALAKRAKIASIKRKTGKLDMQKVAEIMGSGETTRVLGARYGVDQSLISRIKRGEAWKDYSSPWAGLVA